MLLQRRVISRSSETATLKNVDSKYCVLCSMAFPSGLLHHYWVKQENQGQWKKPLMYERPGDQQKCQLLSRLWWIS